jgi:hypothetical protein
MLLGNFASFVITAVRARQVGHGRRAAILADSQGLFAERVMAAALVSAGPGLMLFRYSHESN